MLIFSTGGPYHNRKKRSGVVELRVSFLAELRTYIYDNEKRCDPTLAPPLNDFFLH